VTEVTRAFDQLVSYLERTGWLAPSEPGNVGMLFRPPGSEWMMPVPFLLERGGLDWRLLIDRLASIEGSDAEALVKRIDMGDKAVPVSQAAGGGRCLIAIVQAHMDRHGVSEASVARRIGTTPATVNTWRNGQMKRPPRREYLDKLADLTGVDYCEVLVAALSDTGFLAPRSTDRFGVGAARTR